MLTARGYPVAAACAAQRRARALYRNGHMAMSTPAPRILEANGLALRLWDHTRPGTGEGPIALFLHGYLDTGRSFDAVADALPELRCLALDLRGHGQSARVGAGGSYHLLDHLKDVAVVVDALEKRGERVEVLAAHSMGGNVAFLLAGATPQLVRRLVLLDSCGPPPEDPEEAPARLAELVNSVLGEKRPFSAVATLEEAVEKIRAQNPGLSAEGAARMVQHVMERDEAGGLRFPFDPRLRGPSPIRWPEAMWQAMAARMTMPVLVVRAEDGYVPEGSTTEGRLSRMARASMRTIPGGHHVHVEAPQAVAAAVREALAIAV
jgi:pimeloyl-ACP methyl ester carboxylesterase